MIPFNKVVSFPESIVNINKAVRRNNIACDGFYTDKCKDTLGQMYGLSNTVMTNSCTSALEICALAIKSLRGCEGTVLVPAFGYVSSVNAFSKFGFRIKFLDVDPNTGQIDLDELSDDILDDAIALVFIHYGGGLSPLDKLRSLCASRDIFFVHDAAQSINHIDEGGYPLLPNEFLAVSFHETKNIGCGQGGALFFGDADKEELIYSIRDKGTNRQAFQTGRVDRYTWTAVGGAYAISELSAAYLSGGLENLEGVNRSRAEFYNYYLKFFESKGIDHFDFSKGKKSFNWHLFALKVPAEKRSAFIKSMLELGVITPFHYLPLPLSPIGNKLHSQGSPEQFKNSIDLATSILRLPIFYSEQPSEIAAEVCEAVMETFDGLAL